MADFNNQPEAEKQDYFDLLPDPILLLILNKVLDAKSLCSCNLVSKRFASLIPEIDSIAIEMGPCSSSRLKKSTQDSLSSRTATRSNNFFRGFVSKFVSKPFQILHQIMSKKMSSSSSSKDSGGFDILHWIGTALKNFKEIKSLKLELPCYGGEIGVHKTIPLLKWEASFGKELDRCVILGATSIVQRREKTVRTTDDQAGEAEDEPLFTDEELKLRIIWIISCLIASSARHNLMKKVVDCCPKLSSAVILDAGKQGKLCMDAGQITELRDSMENSSTTTKNPSESRPGTEMETPALTSGSQMGYVGNLVMKLWYVKELELQSCGKVVKGATMVVIRPDSKEERERESGFDLKGVMERAFEGDGVFGEAARELLRKKERRVYRLEMNTF